jgi:hypothetical protein
MPLSGAAQHRLPVLRSDADGVGPSKIRAASAVSVFGKLEGHPKTVSDEAPA